LVAFVVLEGVQYYQPVVESQLRPLGLYYMPKNLLGARWLQFAPSSNDGDTNYRKCRFCQKPFAV